MEDFFEGLDEEERPLLAMSTHWGIIRAAKDISQMGEEARHNLAARYMRPVLHLLQRWGYPIEEAAEYANRLILRIIDGSILQGADEKRGSFRSYLMRTLQNMIREDQRTEQIHREVPISDFDRPQADGDPMAIMEQELAWEIFADARKALPGILRADAVRVFELHDMQDGACVQRTQEEIAAGMGFPLWHFQECLYAARKAFRREVILRLREGCASDEEIPEELAWFRAQIAKGRPSRMA